jgi:hypothetical protein
MRIDNNKLQKTIKHMGNGAVPEIPGSQWPKIWGQTLSRSFFLFKLIVTLYLTTASIASSSFVINKSKIEMPPKKRASRDDEVDDLYKELEAREDEISALQHELKVYEEEHTSNLPALQLIYHDFGEWSEGKCVIKYHLLEEPLSKDLEALAARKQWYAGPEGSMNAERLRAWLPRRLAVFAGLKTRNDNDDWDLDSESDVDGDGNSDGDSDGGKETEGAWVVQTMPPNGYIVKQVIVVSLYRGEV